MGDKFIRVVVNNSFPSFTPLSIISTFITGTFPSQSHLIKGRQSQNRAVPASRRRRRRRPKDLLGQVPIL
jgi:hypothetical protein